MWLLGWYYCTTGICFGNSCCRSPAGSALSFGSVLLTFDAPQPIIALIVMRCTSPKDSPTFLLFLAWTMHTRITAPIRNISSQFSAANPLPSAYSLRNTSSLDRLDCRKVYATTRVRRKRGRARGTCFHPNFQPNPPQPTNILYFSNPSTLTTCDQLMCREFWLISISLSTFDTMPEAN